MKARKGLGHSGSAISWGQHRIMVLMSKISKMLSKEMTIHKGTSKRCTDLATQWDPVDSQST